MLHHSLLFITLSQLAVLRADELMPVNTILGTQAIGGRYHFTQDEPLLESAKLIAELGSGIMKFAISPQGSFGKTKANVIERDARLKTLTDVASKEPAHRAVLDMPFTHFLIWTYPFTTHGTAGQFSTRWVRLRPCSRPPATERTEGSRRYPASNPR